MTPELPRYKCHKEVHALKIFGIELVNGDAKLTFANNNFVPLMAYGYGPKFKGTTEDMGYYVVYEDGYESWSPTKEFQEGYELIEYQG